MRLLSHALFFRIYCLLIFLNTLILFGSQYFVYTKHWDLYWFSSFFYREILLCVSYFLIFWLLSLLFCKLPQLAKGIAFFILVISLVCFVIDVFLLYTFDTNLNSYLVIVALETNPQESADFLHNYLTLPLFGIYAFLGIACWLVWKFSAKLVLIPLNPTTSPKQQKNIAFRLYTALVCGILIILTMIFTHTKPLNEDWSDMIYNYTKQTYRAIENTRGFIEEYKKLNANFDTLAQSLQVKKAKNNIDNIVLVIGESTQRGKLSLYGYELPTTPHLDKLKISKPNNLFIFNDIISPHAQTHESLSLSLTLANQDSQGIQTIHKKLPQKQWYEFLNIIDAFKLGGYHTISISNQEPVSLFGNAAATILKRADEASFVNVNDKMSTTKFDESILEVLDSIEIIESNLPENREDIEGAKDSINLTTESALKSSTTNAIKIPADKHRFYALHLMGNHAKYYNRYPTNFAHFASKDMLCQEDNSPQKGANIEENMHYDNATLYGDFILSEIIKRFESSDSIVIYFSDHGEEIYDFRNFIGHSDSKISRFMVEIPFIIYVSDSFIQKHPKLYKRLQRAQNTKYMNDDLMHTLLDIAGISLKGYESQRSLIATNKAFLKSRMRKVGEKSNIKDYDKELKTQESYIQQGLCQKKE
ncbi:MULTISPECIES: sulfatase-like hydrolase/transferase [Helicobacter]|nr:sulfatase-like hydrolase/transferase [Helicobacter sp. MIT 03-1616]TLD88292.1 sulfatase [Helicobacter sp. MIT 03-1616]